MRMTIVMIAALSASFCGGCATVLRGSEQTMTVQTDPIGVSMTVDGKKYITPAKLELRRKSAHEVTLRKDGYRTVQFNLTPEWDGISLVGAIIIPGGSLGLIVDKVSGADMNFYTLAKIRMAPSTRSDEPPIILTDFKGELLTDDEYTRALAYDRGDRAQFFRGEP